LRSSFPPLSHTLSVGLSPHSSVSLSPLCLCLSLSPHPPPHPSINYGNEKLQQYFIHYVLKKEQETYEGEGISVDHVETMDNQDVLHLLESKPFGVFAILDEELKLPQGSDAGFIRKVEKEYKEKSSRFKRDFRMKNEQFEIHHFAGKVLYSATNFLDKNKDKVYEHLETLLISSKVMRFNEMMQSGGDILPSSISSGGSGGGGGGKSNGKHQRQVDTLASRFTGQLHQLITVLQESEPHFVRCIKPNNMKNPISFDTDLVLRQLRYSGVLEVCSSSLSLSVSLSLLSHSLSQTLYLFLSLSFRQYKFVKVDTQPVNS
jgi:myosin heavy subunit